MNSTDSSGTAVANPEVAPTTAKPKTTKNYEAIAQKYCAEYPNMKDLRVLEVGSDINCGLLNAMAPHVGEIVGTNIIGQPRQVAPNATFDIGDIRKTNFESSSFDLIISFAVFEHVQDFDVAVNEMARLLKPGGEVSTQFGPIWSCIWGHHLWVTGKERMYTYNRGPFLPPYCHLLMTPKELEEYLEPSVPEEELSRIVDFVFESQEQNRLFHKDYVNAIQASEFEVKRLVSNRNLNLEQEYIDLHGPIEKYVEQLEAQYGVGDYLTASFTAKLRKPS